MTQRSETENEILHPSQFASRAEFRKALIEQKREIGRDVLANLTERLQAFDLKITPAHLSRALVIEGAIKDLDSAMSEPEVIDATPDAPLGLSLSEQDENSPNE